MALHKAEQIMVAVLANITGLTTTSTRVKRGRVYPWKESTANALSLYMGADNPIDADGYTNTAFVDRELTIYIDVKVKTSTVQIDTTLNLIRAEVYVAMMADYTQGLGFILNTIPRGDDEPSLSSETDKTTATQRMSFGIQYRHSLTDPTA